ncbi:hypothetical protein B0T25DRAFT_567406 [Lasiosphaeria hispida]|uniref:Uncharacterized protein n=1 Tax=Lasiosphaeria hispida TaxID=260671 RepID=A0AAJ0HNK1_9PEZI|nr:hypothetical protein B0T25DRAFT_567406 [Lasiosphaeria hispida]
MVGSTDSWYMWQFFGMEEAVYKPTWAVFGYRSIVPWVSSSAISSNRNICFITLPALTLAVMFLALAFFAEYLIRVQPEGSQPSTYGDV